MPARCWLIPVREQSLSTGDSELHLHWWIFFCTLWTIYRSFCFVGNGPPDACIVSPANSLKSFSYIFFIIVPPHAQRNQDLVLQIFRYWTLKGICAWSALLTNSYSLVKVHCFGKLLRHMDWSHALLDTKEGYSEIILTG